MMALIHASKINKPEARVFSFEFERSVHPFSTLLEKFLLDLA